MFFKKPNIETEDELYTAVAELPKGGVEAFQVLYKHYQQKVYRFCLRMLSDTGLAQDAFQETFVKVYEHRKEFRGSNFAPWLFTIARHVCLNTIRTKKDYDSFDETMYSYEKDNGSDYSVKDAISKAIATLPASLREALLLREYEEYSYQDIADILNIDLSLAKIRVHRARNILRKILKPLAKELYES